MSLAYGYSVYVEVIEGGRVVIEPFSQAVSLLAYVVYVVGPSDARSATKAQPNKGMQATGNSVRSCVAPAIPRA
jgi:hypothetical protein